VRRLLPLALLLTLVPAGAADARDGKRWPSGTITYREVPADAGVRDGAAAWNRSGVRVRFRRVRSTRRAQVVIRIERREGCAGIAQLGYVRGVQAQVRLLRCPRFDQTLVTAHELGHVLGLGHEGRACALMNPVLVNGTPQRCEQPADGLYRCRVFELHDLRRAARMYGGRPKVPAAATCPLFAPLAAPSLSVVPGPDGRPRAQVVTGDAPAPLVESRRAQLGSRAQLELGAAEGPCPADLAPVLAAPFLRGHVGWGRTVDAGGARSFDGPTCIAARFVEGAVSTPPVSVELPPLS
jgi:hypothetical protein